MGRNIICFCTWVLNWAMRYWASTLNNRVRKKEEGMPRALNIITGPSRTADVEQTIQLGAHGPRRMHVIIYS